MKRNVVCAIAFLAGCCLADTVSSFFGQQVIVDGIFAGATLPAWSAKALAALESIAEGKPENVDASVAAVVGMPTDTKNLVDFKNPTVIAHALRKLGDTGLPEVIDYLERVNAAGFAADPTGQIRAAAQVALQQARLLQIPNRQQKIDFLEALLANWGLASWSVDQLCDMGSMPSLGLIGKSIRQRNPGPRSEEEIEFCEARVRLLNSSPDRTQALASALKLSSNMDDRRLIFWAVSQLTAMQTPDANAILEKYAAGIDRLPETSPERQLLFAASSVIKGQSSLRASSRKLH